MKMFEYADYIRTIQECGSFTKAADQLCITQPALSLMVRKMEEELGSPLLIRTKKGAILTEKGELYLQAAREVAEIETNVRDHFLGNKREIQGEIQIGAAGICMRYIMPKILKELYRKHPAIKVHVVEESYYSLRDQLLQEKLDLMLDTESYHPKIDHVRLFPNKLFYAIPIEKITDSQLLAKGLSAQDIKNKEHENGNSHKILMQDVLDIPFLSLQPRNELYARSEMLFHYYSCRPETLMFFNQQLTAYQFAQHGFGATFISDTLIKMQPSDKVLYYEFYYELPERWISIGYLKDRYLSKAMQAFMEVAQEKGGQTPLRNSYKIVRKT